MGDLFCPQKFLFANGWCGGGAKPQIMSKSTTLNYPETCIKLALITLRSLKVKVNVGGGGVVMEHTVLNSTCYTRCYFFNATKP